MLLSAIPEADPNRTRSKEHIQLRSEDIPRLTELPPGCAFHPRCPWFVPGVCDARVPELDAGPGAASDARSRLHSAHRRRRTDALFMNPEALKAFFRGGVFIAGVALMLMLAVPRDSAEFVVSTCSLLIGLALIGGVGLGDWSRAAECEYNRR